jgi:hypothetical protein
VGVLAHAARRDREGLEARQRFATGRTTGFTFRGFFARIAPFPVNAAMSAKPPSLVPRQRTGYLSADEIAGPLKWTLRIRL